MSETGGNSLEIPARKKNPSHPFLWIGNEVFDLFLPIVGTDCFAVYAYFVRRYHSDPFLKHDIRNVADSCGLSASTASRACEVLEHLRLLKLCRFGGSRQSECELFDSWAVALRLGAEYDSNSKSYRFPAHVSQRLKSEIRTIRERQQGHAQGAIAATNTCGNPALRVSRRNSSVSPEKCQRATRETQTGSHLLRKEERTERILAPTPSQDGELWKTKNHANEDGPVLEPLRSARVLFTGVRNDMKDHLLNTSRPPMSRLTNAFEDWRSGFESLGVERVTECRRILVIVLSACDPAAARRVLEKYRQKWNKSLQKWFNREVEVELVSRSAKSDQEPNSQSAGGG